MNKSAFSELFFKVFRSGNPHFLFIGINVCVFLALNLLHLGEFLTGGSGLAAAFLTRHLGVPSDIAELPLKFWTPLSDMFTQKDFFHLLFNMLWLFWLGQIFLDFLNRKQFVFIYFAGGIAGALLYLIAFNTIPAFHSQLGRSVLIGSSASVMAIVFATATLVPNFTIRLLFFGNVKLKFLALAYLLLSLIGVGSSNAGGNVAHLGGALMGFLFINQLQRGNDWSKIFQKKRKLKVVKSSPSERTRTSHPDQHEIDRILDKISQSGYESLSKTEKETLFKASKK